MRKLLSLPPNLVGCFHDITGFDKKEWFCTNDPVGRKLGSGGGTTWLLRAAYKEQDKEQDFDSWLKAEKRLLLHAGGQSRRLPAYAPSGKILTPIPVFRWERGQRLSQDLLSLQIPLYKHIMEKAPDSLHTMIVSGDVYIRATEPLQPIPEADVVCYGLWLGPETAKNHGVFVSSRKSPEKLKCMLQKPSVSELNELLNEHFYLTDIGIWLLSDRAVKVLMKKSERDGDIINYDMYGEFGCALGSDAPMKDEDVNALSVAVLPLPGGEFYHFGTSHEILSSTLAVQNLVNDQRRIMHRDRKPHPAMFIQNAMTGITPSAENGNMWIENSCVGKSWTVASENIITGVPHNNWNITLKKGQCVDVVPMGETRWAVRPYGYNDKFRGDIHYNTTEFIGQPFTQWAATRGINLETIEHPEDLQAARIFPVTDNIEEMGIILRWMLNEPDLAEGKTLWENARHVSADEISAGANLRRLTQQRTEYRAANWEQLACNHRYSVFYQTDLEDAAKEFVDNKVTMPSELSEDEPMMTRIHDAMFRSEVERMSEERRLKTEDKRQMPADKDKDTKDVANRWQNHAFSLLREGLTETALADRQSPHMSVYGDQIVWGRSPVRIDIAGGWTDTPPFCLSEGGNVINLATELNGQPPLQTYVKPCKEHHIVLRSIDLGSSEVVDNYEGLSDFCNVGSPFSIPKAALVLSGFHPRYSLERYNTLREQLEAFGCGIEVTLLSAIPAGSGLGTSSLLASTVLGALNDFCGLGWDKNEIGHRTLVLEQLLTTGGGWQDQFGGLLQGVKLLQTAPGFEQSPVVRWLPNDIYIQPEYKDCHLLYYTGITRTAKTILAGIVRRMFLNHGGELSLLREMKAHTMEMYDAIQRNDFCRMGHLVRKTWAQNQELDSGTNPESIQTVTRLIDDLCLGYKLPGAGGGGYLYMIAKDPQAAARIKQILTEHNNNPNARFVDMSLSEKGLQVSRS